MSAIKQPRTHSDGSQGWRRQIPCLIVPTKASLGPGSLPSSASNDFPNWRDSFPHPYPPVFK